MSPGELRAAVSRAVLRDANGARAAPRARAHGGGAAGKSDGERLRAALKAVATHAAVDGRRARVLREGGANLVDALVAAGESGDPALLRLGALVFARLSAEADAAALLAAGDGLYLGVLDSVLAFDVARTRDAAEVARVREGRRLAARGVRNLAAFGEENAVAVARSSGVVGKLVALVAEGVDGGTSGETVEASAALANLSRYGWKFQAYVRKHDGMAVLARAARCDADPAVMFHAMRALAEFSLEQRWQAQLVSDGVVNVALRIISRTRDEEIVSEATRCVGNVAASRTGRSAILSAGGVETVARRVVMLAAPERGGGGGAAAAAAGGGSASGGGDGKLAADLLRAMANLCVGSKEASQRVINSGGVMALISACDQDVPHGASADLQHATEAVKTEAFRGLLIVAQAGPSFRATVLREIGVRTRNESAFGRCTAHLYDLARRVKVEASTERKDDVPQTIAGLGEASKDYLFKAGPLATGGPRHGDRERSSHGGRRSSGGGGGVGGSSPHSLPGMESPSTAAFRQSGRVLSVQRPQHHRARLEKERQMRCRGQGCSECTCSAVTAATGAGVVAEGSYTEDGRMASSNSSSRHKSASSRTRASSSCSHCNCGGAAAPSELSGVTTSVEGPDIPRCRVVDVAASGTVAGTPMAKFNNHHTSGGGSGGAGAGGGAHSPGKDSENEDRNNWAMQVWSYVCKPLARPPPKELPAQDGDLEEDVFELGTPLGRGGFATVFLAKNLRTEELVAVKRFHPVASALPDAKKKAELAARRALKEQRIWDGLTHRNVVAYKGCFFGEEGELNLVAEYVPGWSLADHLSQITKFPEHLVARITKQIVDGLDYLHREGVTHRDIKPANILVDPAGIVKLTDFGVSSALDVPTMTGNTLVGTPWYIAPEMIEGRPYGKSVDIWSLGCTVMELATGKRPYHQLRAHEVMFRIAQDRKAPPIPSSVSPQLRDFLLTCFIFSAEKRPLTSHLRRHPFLAKI